MARYVFNFGEQSIMPPGVVGYPFWRVAYFQWGWGSKWLSDNRVAQAMEAYPTQTGFARNYGEGGQGAAVGGQKSAGRGQRAEGRGEATMARMAQILDGDGRDGRDGRGFQI